MTPEIVVIRAEIPPIAFLFQGRNICFDTPITAFFIVSDGSILGMHTSYDIALIEAERFGQALGRTVEDFVHLTTPDDRMPKWPLPPP